MAKPPGRDDTKEFEGCCGGCMIVVITWMVIWFVIVYCWGGGFK